MPQAIYLHISLATCKRKYEHTQGESQLCRRGKYLCFLQQTECIKFCHSKQATVTLHINKKKSSNDAGLKFLFKIRRCRTRPIAAWIGRGHAASGSITLYWRYMSSWLFSHWPQNCLPLRQNQPSKLIVYLFIYHGIVKRIRSGQAVFIILPLRLI